MKKLKAILSDAGRASRLLAAGLGLFVCVASAYAVGASKWTNGWFTGTLQVDGTSTLGTVVESTTTFRLRQSTAPSSANTAVQIVPIGIGDMVINWTDKEVCFATGTTRLQWVKMSTPTAACGH